MPERALLALYRGLFFFGLCRMLAWTLWARVLADPDVVGPLDLSVEGPSWIEARSLRPVPTWLVLPVGRRARGRLRPAIALWEPMGRAEAPPAPVAPACAPSILVGRIRAVDDTVGCAGGIPVRRARPISVRPWPSSASVRRARAGRRRLRIRPVPGRGLVGALRRRQLGGRCAPGAFVPPPCRRHGGAAGMVARGSPFRGATVHSEAGAARGAARRPARPTRVMSDVVPLPLPAAEPAAPPVDGAVAEVGEGDDTPPTPAWTPMFVVDDDLDVAQRHLPLLSRAFGRVRLRLLASAPGA